MDLDAVEPGLHRVDGSLPKRLDDSLHFVGPERARRFIRHHLAVCRHRHHPAARNRHRRRCDRQRAAGLKRGMRDAADMPELEKDHAALGMNRIDDAPPTPDLLIGIDAGGRRIAASRHHDRRGLGDNQAARRGALTVIFGIERARREARSLRPHPRQWRHHHAMLQPIGADLKRRKQRRKIHLAPEMLVESCHTKKEWQSKTATPECGILLTLTPS